MPQTSLYLQSSYQELKERIIYEEWLIEAVYAIASQNLFPSYPDEVIFALNDPNAKLSFYGSINVNIGDWRPNFLQVGAPLIFSVIFKILDMFMEWVIANNGKTVNFRFSEKIKALNGNILFPDPIETNTWLKERLIGLYTNIEPLRGTIIHDKHFTSSGDYLEVASSKKGVIGNPIKITGQELRCLASTIITVIRYVDKTSVWNDLGERLLKYNMDELYVLHGCSILGQKRPRHLGVRIYTESIESVMSDIATFKKHIFQLFPNIDCSFDLRILLVSSKQVVKAYLVPWDVLSCCTKITFDENMRQKYSTSIPSDLIEGHYI